MIVKKRDGTITEFNSSKIYNSITKANKQSNEINSEVLVLDVVNNIYEYLSNHQDLTIEVIQDAVVKELSTSYPLTAKVYQEFRVHKHELRERQHSRDKIAVAESAKYFKDPRQLYQFYSKYARWNEHKKRRETFAEAVDRVIVFFKKECGNKLGESDYELIKDYMLNLKASCAMRVLQMAGPALERCHVGVYNCSAIGISSLDIFAEMLYISMQGTGVGFSVEDVFVNNLPIIEPQTNINKLPYIVEDSTEGWCNALKTGLHVWFNGDDVEFDFSKIRRKGARLKIKGGRASGREPLVKLLKFVKAKIIASQGKKLSSLDVHDIACMIGCIVQVGGVRRSAMCSLFSPDDNKMQVCKSGEFWTLNDQRTMANNSIAHNSKPSEEKFWEMWKTLENSGTGEPGIFNREAANNHIPERRNLTNYLVMNPCFEILLKSNYNFIKNELEDGGGFCNLTIAVAREHDTWEDLAEKVKVASIIGTIQSSLTKFNYISEGWRKNAEEERLLGVDIIGSFDSELLRPNNPNLNWVLWGLKSVAVKTNEEYAAKLGIEPSVAVTCIKPSGNSSQLFDASSSILPRFSEFYLRRYQANKTDPLTKLLVDSNVPYIDYSESLVSFEFPVKSPEGIKTSKDVTAIDILENYKIWMTNYVEHNVSITVYVDKHEWKEVGQWVWDNWNFVVGLAFLPKSDHIYKGAPYEEISKEEYEYRKSTFPEIDFSKLSYYENKDETTSAQELACVSGNCEI